MQRRRRQEAVIAPLERLVWPRPVFCQEELIEQSRTDAAFEAAVTVDGDSRPPALLAAAKSVLQRGREVIERRFMASHDGAACLAESTYLIDTLIRSLHRVAIRRLFRISNPTEAEHLAVCAVGGYGRGELAPQSDIDLLFLLPWKPTPVTEQVVEFLYYTLWDLGLKVGHSTRSVDECLRHAMADLTIRTSLLEVRYLTGDRGLFTTLERRFDEEVIAGQAGDFVDGKLLEREDRHRRLGDSRYVLEPNVKEGKGGLRDLHGLLWIAKYQYRVQSLSELVERGVLMPDEVQRFNRDQSFLWTVRCHLHYLTRRPEERLTFEVQAEIGRRMGYTDRTGARGVERFMKHYFLIAKDVGDLTRTFVAVLEASQKRRPRSVWRRFLPVAGLRMVDGFALDNGRLTAPGPDIFTKDPVNLLRLFHVAQANNLDIHPEVLRLIRRSLRLINAAFRQAPEPNRLFLEILTSPRNPEVTLRRMSEAGVLGRFIPDFGRVVAQMQYDMYHVYTTDEHTLFAVGVLHGIETGALSIDFPVASSVIGSIASRRALYLAIFLHDIAKGRGGDHSELGARIALKLGPRLGLTPEETETVAWLVRYHLLMSRVAFKRDLDDKKTIEDFVAIVQSPERLKLLLVLTAADIRAVGPTTWNGWKGALLRRLFTLAHDIMSGTGSSDSQAAAIARTLNDVRAMLPDFDNAAFGRFAELGSPGYFLSNDTATLARHARVMRDAERDGEKLTVRSKVDEGRAVTEIIVYTADHAGLFSRLAGALAVAGAHVVDARIVTMANGMALDTFWLQDGDGAPFGGADKLDRLAVQFEQVLTGQMKPHLELTRRPVYPSRTRVFTVPPRVLIDNLASATQTLIEVNGRDRPGLLFDLTRALTGLGLQISGAKITTYGEKVVDVFFVKDVFGLKLVQPERLEEIRLRLISVLAGEEPGRTAQPARVVEPV